MGVRYLEELVAWQLAEALKKRIYAILIASPGAQHDFAFRDQLRRATASVAINIGEGFHRFGAGEFRRFLSIALGSLAEARLWLHDGVTRGYFQPADCTEIFALVKRCRAATLRLRDSLGPFTNPPRPPTRSNAATRRLLDSRTKRS
jgi:four helix bundle protein